MACNDLISDTDIKNIYMDYNLIVKNNIKSKCKDDNIKESVIVLIDKNGDTMLERNIERIYYREKRLYSRENQFGKVAEHKYFILKDNFQRKKIASKVHKKELTTYVKNEFDEIHLEAAWDGLVVWKKMLYKFANHIDENLIKIAIHRYLKEVKNMSIEDIEKAIKNNPFSVNPKYLKDNNGDFKNWVYENLSKIGLAEMYKEVA